MLFGTMQDDPVFVVPLRALTCDGNHLLRSQLEYLVGLLTVRLNYAGGARTVITELMLCFFPTLS